MVKLPVGSFCSMDHVIAFTKKKQNEQIQKKIKKDKLSQDKKRKANKKAVRDVRNNDKRHQFKLTKQAIQKWVNHVRDSELGCISCGTTNANIVFSGGHYKTAGGNPEIALESRNIHRQCLFHCNKNKSGNINGDKHSIGFKQGLINRYGDEYVEWLESYHKPISLDCDQLRTLRAYYNRLIRENKKTDDDRPFL